MRGEGKEKGGEGEGRGREGRGEGMGGRRREGRGGLSGNVANEAFCLKSAPVWWPPAQLVFLFYYIFDVLILVSFIVPVNVIK